MNSEQVVELCADVGFVVREVSLHKGVLLLTPDARDALPSAEILRELALQLRSAEVRWVTLNLEGSP